MNVTAVALLPTREAGDVRRAVAGRIVEEAERRAHDRLQAHATSKREHGDDRQDP